MILKRIADFFRSIGNSLWPIEADSEDEFIDHIRKDGGHHDIEVMLKCLRWSANDTNQAFSAVCGVNHYRYYLVARATSDPKKKDIVLSQWVSDGTTVSFGDKDGGCRKITDLENEAEEAIRLMAEKIAEAVPSASIKISRARSIFDGIFGKEGIDTTSEGKS